MGNACVQVNSVSQAEDAIVLNTAGEEDEDKADFLPPHEDINGNKGTRDIYRPVKEESCEVAVYGSPVRAPRVSFHEDEGGKESQRHTAVSCSRKSSSVASSHSDVGTVVMKVDTIEYRDMMCKELDLLDWYIDAAQELLRKQGILKTDVTCYQSMDFDQKADVWCNDKEDMVDKVELCGCLLKGCEKIGSDGSKWISIDEHFFLPVLIQGCRVIFSGDLKFKPIINEWVIDTTKELPAKNLLGVGWYCGMDVDSDIIANSTKPNGKVVKGSTTFDKKGFPWICVDTSIGFYMPIFIDGKQVAFAKR